MRRAVIADQPSNPRLVRTGLRGAVQATCLAAAVLAAAGAVGSSRGPVVLDTPQQATATVHGPAAHGALAHGARSR